MAIEYLIDRPCPVKEKMPFERIARMLKQRSGAEQILQLELQGAKSQDEARNVKIVSERYGPDGNAVTGEATIGAILDETAVLFQLAGVCQDCPAALGKPFGCHGAINYPVSAKSEQWLMELAARALEMKTPGMMALEFILDKKFRGEPFSEMRRDPRFFESRRPLELVVAKGMLGKKTINSDQLLQFLLPSSLTEGAHMRIMSFFSGGLTVQDGPPAEDAAESAFSITDKEGKERWWVYDLPDGPQDDPAIRQWRRYFRSVFRTHSMDAHIKLDY